MSEPAHKDDVSQLRAEVEDLKAQLARLSPLPVEGSRVESDGAATIEARTGRRELFKMAGAAALGAVGAATLISSPAGANTGTMIFGAENNAGTDFTQLDSSNSVYSLVVQNGGAGAAVVGTASSGNAVEGATNGGSGNAVQGYTTGTGNAVFAQIDNSSSSAVGAVYATTNGTGSGVWGEVTNDTSSAAAIHGTTTGTGVAVKGIAAGTGNAVEGDINSSSSSAVAVYGTTTGTGNGVLGDINNPSSAGAAVLALTNGTGPAVQGQSASGYGVWGEITNASNGSAAVLGTTKGTGPGVEGIGVSGPGLQGTGNGVGVSGKSPKAGGRGGKFQGGNTGAALQLVPATVSTHPTSGLRGDFFVDSGGHLWFCTTGGSTATWAKLA
jgi:hypothetical protein